MGPSHWHWIFFTIQTILHEHWVTVTPDCEYFHGAGSATEDGANFGTNQFGQELVREMALLGMPKHQTERPLKMSRATL